MSSGVSNFASYQSCSPDASQRKTLSQLLGPRTRRQRQRPPPAHGLKDAVIRFMSRHQNLGDLLLEVDGSVSRHLSSPRTVTSDVEETKAAAEDSLLASVLQEQALQVDLPVALLSARASAEKIHQILSVVSRRTVMLNSAQRSKFTRLLQTMQDLQCSNMFSRLQFSQEIWKSKEQPILEAVWRLQKENIVSLEELVQSNPDAATVVHWLFKDLCELCLGTEDQQQNSDIQRQILSDIVTVLVRNGFQESSFVESKRPQFPQVCFTVLDRMLSWMLNDVCQQRKEDDSSHRKAPHFWLGVFDTALYHGTVSLERLKQFFCHMLTQALTYNPVLEASDAIRMQREWCFAKTWPHLTTLYRKLFVLFGPEELIAHLRHVLETHEVNWQNVLSCVSTLLVCQPDTQQQLKGLLDRLLINAFESYELESIITAFLLARQAALEGPAVFISYSEWFKISFGSASSYHGGSKKALVFLLKFLTDLVPFESAPYLKVHMLYPPYVGSKYRLLLMEYISLAKTRLLDLQESVEEMGLYEDPSAAQCPPEPQSQALLDVEKALVLFENNSKIPASIMEASIFRRPYYMSRFLPALLTPRVLPQIPDVRLRFIESLKKADKIPANMHTSYLHACEEEKRQWLEGVSVMQEMEHPKEPTEMLKAALEELRNLVMNPGNDAVPAQIAVISAQLGAMIEDGDEFPGADQPLRLNPAATNAEPLELVVRDLLLKSFCQTLLTASHFNPPHGQGEWASQFVRMLGGHRRVLRSVLTRVLHLISHQGPSLSDGHILGLAAFTVQVYISQSFLPLVDSMDQGEKSSGKAGVSFSDYLTHFLSCTTGESLTFCMRFCTATVAYGLCLSSPATVDVLKRAVPSGFVRKLLYVLPRLIPESRVEQAEVTESTWPNLTSPDLNWNSAALSAFKHSQFKELTKVKDFQLTFHDWLMAELDIQPHEDVLSDIDRLDYQHWVCYQHYLPSPPSAGGCAGDLESMCRTIINALMDFSKRVKLQYCQQSDRSRPASLRTSCYVDILCRLQEMVFELERVRMRTASKRVRRESGHFLLDIFVERAASPGNTELRKQLEHELELQIFVRILVALPPSVLFLTREERLSVTVECEEFFHFTNKELRNGYCKDGVIPYDSIAHFFKGLLNACADCDEVDRVLAALLNECRGRCPLLLLSAAGWWPRLEPVLIAQWKRFSEASLPRELQRLTEDHRWANRLLLGSVDEPPSDAPWILGAFLYFTFRRQNRLRAFETVMRKIRPENEQLQVSVLFLGLMDLISSMLQPQESLDSTVAVKTCADVVRVLEEQGKPWFNVFLVTGSDRGPYQILHSVVSDVQIRLLPLAFYRLVLDLGSKLLSSVIKRPGFLLIAVTMYAAMGQLYLDGEGVVPTSDYCAIQTPEQPDVLGLLTRGRHLLLRIIPCCPGQTNSERKQIQEACKDIDPEVKATLDHNLQFSKNYELNSEPDFL